MLLVVHHRVAHGAAAELEDHVEVAPVEAAPEKARDRRMHELLHEADLALELQEAAVALHLGDRAEEDAPHGDVDLRPLAAKDARLPAAPDALILEDVELVERKQKMSKQKNR